MVRITREVLRQRSEHHDGILPDLEEISLHQMEIEKIEVIGEICRKLQILYLQNNIISKIENIHWLKDLRYLNLALNNITRIEGLQSCEFLQKLDLTVNFIDVDTLEDSITHLQSREHLKELYMIGNPAADWSGFRAYVIVMLPQLKSLDGQEISRTDRINAAQQLQTLQSELKQRAKAKREQKAREELSGASKTSKATGNESSPWTPETRVEMYREIAEQKAEDERQKRANEPKRRDYAQEHAEAVSKARAEDSIVLNEQSTDASQCDSKAYAASGLNSETRIRQRNDGKWEFQLEEEDGYGNTILRLQLPRFVDSSLVDVDSHPSHITIVVKGKIFRINWPEEVRSDDGTASRSKTTGELVIKMPKVHKREAFMKLRRAQLADLGHKDTFGKKSSSKRDTSNTSQSKKSQPITTTSSSNKTLKLADLMISEAAKSRATKPNKSSGNDATSALLKQARSTKTSI